MALVFLTAVPLDLGALRPVAEDMLALMRPALDDLYHPHPLIFAAIVDSGLDCIDLAALHQRQGSLDLEQLVCLDIMDGPLNRPRSSLQQVFIVSILLFSQPLSPLIPSLVLRHLFLFVIPSSFL